MGALNLHLLKPSRNNTHISKCDREDKISNTHFNPQIENQIRSVYIDSFWSFASSEKIKQKRGFLVAQRICPLQKLLFLVSCLCFLFKLRCPVDVHGKQIILFGRLTLKESNKKAEPRKQNALVATWLTALCLGNQGTPKAKRLKRQPGPSKFQLEYGNHSTPNLWLVNSLKVGSLRVQEDLSGNVFRVERSLRMTPEVPSRVVVVFPQIRSCNRAGFRVNQSSANLSDSSLSGETALTTRRPAQKDQFGRQVSKTSSCRVLRDR